MTNPFSITVLISGGGTTLKNLIEYREAGKLEAEIGLVVSNNPNSGGLQFAKDAGIPYQVIDHKNFVSDQSFNEALFDACRESSCDLVVCGGFLRLLIVPDDFENRIINIHPSLIPAYSGKGFYGMRVHSAVIAAGEKESGCTVHFVDNIYDHGKIIAQQTVDVFPNDTPEILQKRVFEAECQLLPAAINNYAREANSKDA